MDDQYYPEIVLKNINETTLSYCFDKITFPKNKIKTHFCGLRKEGDMKV